MSKTLITSQDPKGLQFMSLCGAAYNKAKLDSNQAQRLNESGGELQAGLRELIKKLSVSNQFANEVVSSNYVYPSEYQGPRPIGEQVDILAVAFQLSRSYTSDFAQKVLPTLHLPNGADGWFAIPSVNAVAKVNFPKVTDPAEQYCCAVNLVLKKLADRRPFYNYWKEGQIDPSHLRQHARTIDMLAEVAKQQPGDILILPCQLGLLHRGESIRRAREIFCGNEFGLGAFAVCCMVLTHPNRFVRHGELHADCAGDEFSDGGNAWFKSAPYFRFYEDKLQFSARFVGDANGGFGAATAFLPQ